MREIGGYLGFELSTGNNIYHSDAIALNFTRNAIKYIVISRKINKLYIPFFLCDAVRNMLIKSGIEYENYHIAENMLPQFEKSMEENEAILIVNYYGQLGYKEIVDLKNRFKNIILDNTHAFFEQHIKGIDTVYSARKYFGIPDGAYLYTGAKYPFDLEKTVMANSYEHLIGRHEVNAEKYYSTFREFETRVNEEDIMEMSTFTQLILSKVDYDEIFRIRVKNFKYLHEKLETINLLSMNNVEATYMYPLRIKNATKIREKLISQKIYVPILWPNVLEEVSSNKYERGFANDILPLPIDQRYTEEDMKYIVNCIYGCCC